MNIFDDKDEKDKLENDDSKYRVEEEKIKTVFVEKKVKIEEDEQEVPQHKEDYQVKSQLVEEETNGVVPITINKEMRQSFLEYAMSVIVARALPDCRDGLKPVHRRILYSMHEQGITSSSAHKKSARIVGDVLGKYHPHGDTAVYEAMVRMAQDFSMRYPMVDGHGNFGSIDGDGAAAMRYTEARMSKIANLMVDSMKKETVDMVDNYDGSELEPAVLPARIPNLLISGATGIAVGMATSIPPHNLKDTIDAVIALAKNSEIDIQELISIVQAPDFPTGALLLGRAGINTAYYTGKGYVTIRSKSHIEELKNGKTRIIVTEIPYMVNKSLMVERIAELVKDKIVDGITDLRDESSRHGIRVVIELKRDVVPEVVRNKLFKLTQLQTKFTINLLSLVKGEPKILNLKQILNVFLDHQIEIVTRRSQFDLDKAAAKAHILEGLKIAISNIDRVIAIVRKSKNDSDAHESLMSEFKLSIEQAKAVVEMRLGRLTGLAIDKMNEELTALNTEIAELRHILENRQALIDLIVKELSEIRDRFGDDRRSEILNIEENIDDEDLIPVKDIAITMSSKGYVKRVPLEEFTVQNRGGVGAKSMSTYEDDSVEKIVVTTTHTDLLILTDYGKVYRIRAHQIPELSKQAKGLPFLNIIDIEKDEKVIALLTTNEYPEDKYLMTVTHHGIIKKTSLAEYERINKNGKIALGMKEGDMLHSAQIISDEDQILIGSNSGNLVRFNSKYEFLTNENGNESSTGLRPMGRTASGNKGISLDAKESVVGTSVTSDGKCVLAISELGFGKLSLLDNEDGKANYRITKRGSKGVRTIDAKKAGKLIFIKVVNGDEEILVTTKLGITIRMSLASLDPKGRNTKGVKFINLKEGNKIKSIAVINTRQIEEQVDEAIRKTTEFALPKSATNTIQDITQDSEDDTEE